MMEDTMVYNGTIFYSGDYVSFRRFNIKYEGQIYIGNKEEIEKITKNLIFSKIIWLFSNTLEKGDKPEHYIPSIKLGYQKFVVCGLRNDGSLSDMVTDLKLLKHKNIFDRIIQKAFIKL